MSAPASDTGSRKTSSATDRDLVQQQASSLVPLSPVGSGVQVVQQAQKVVQQQQNVQQSVNEQGQQVTQQSAAKSVQQQSVQQQVTDQGQQIVQQASKVVQQVQQSHTEGRRSSQESSSSFQQETVQKAQQQQVTQQQSANNQSVSMSSSSSSVQQSFSKSFQSSSQSFQQSFQGSPLTLGQSTPLQIQDVSGIPADLLQQQMQEQLQKQLQEQLKLQETNIKQFKDTSQQSVDQQQAKLQEQFNQQSQFVQQQQSQKQESVQQTSSKQVHQQQQAITEDLRSRTIVKQESGLYKEEQSGAKYRQVQLQRLPIGSNLSTQDVTAIVKTPSGGVDLASIGTNPDGSVGVRYDPKEEGVHELHVKIKGDHIQGSPFKLHVDSLTTKKVTAYGSGLTHGVTGEISNFLIALNNNTGGGLQVAIDGPSKAEITIADNKDGTVSVNYLPTQPGEYQIVVRFGGEEIAGSPFIAQVTGEAKRKSHSSNMPTMTPVLLKLAEKDIKNLTSTIVTPAGIEETATVKKLPNGSLGVSFTPKQSGQHFVNVKRGNNHIVGSPFIINVLEREIADATKVKLSGQGLKEGKVRVDNDFLIDTRDSGYGGLSLSVEGPSKAEISGNQIEDGILRMTYRVNEPGFYVVMVKFADNHVPGSPLTVKVVA